MILLRELYNYFSSCCLLLRYYSYYLSVDYCK